MADLAKKIVLIVEDEEDVRTTLIELAAERGYEPIAVPDGTQAFAVLERTLPAAIILDLRLPKMDGWTFDRVRRKRPALVIIPLIAVTAATDEELGDVKPDAVFRKPFDGQALFDKVDELVMASARRRLLGRR
jgi:CheY-like chemotaxis protein